MLINSFSPEKVALIFAHYAYRNTEIEDMHAGNSVIMDTAVYERAYKIVSKKIRSIKRNHAFFLSVQDEAELILRLQKLGGTRPLEITRYCLEVGACAIYSYGTDWDKPKLLDDEIPNDLACYILNGAFLECCNKHVAMDDVAMCYINKDIYNRFYTLVLKKIL